MRIAIDCRTILDPDCGECAGVGHYTSAVVYEMLRQDQESEFLLYFDRKTGEQTIKKLVGNNPKVQVRYFPSCSLSRVFPLFCNHVLKAWFIKKDRPDVLFSPSGTLPLCYWGPTVVMVHDLAIYHHPEWFPEPAWLRNYSTKLLVPRSIKKARAIIVPSQATANDLEQLFPFTKNKITVIPHGARQREIGQNPISSELREKFNLPDEYFLSMCTIEPRKNITAAIKAFDVLLHRYPDRAQEIRFAIAGKQGWMFGEVFQHIDRVNQYWDKQLGIKPIKYLGYVSNEEKWALLANAMAFVYPSKHEGFGLPILEAMSVATPVITSKNTSLQEVGGEAVFYTDTDNPEIIAHMYNKLIDPHFRGPLAIKGHKHSQKFTWSAAAKKTLEVLARVDSEE